MKETIMKSEEVIKILLNQNYEDVKLDDQYGELYDNNLQIFGDKIRIIFVKEFRTELSFYKWTNDQAIIASQYKSFSAKQKKNLYFFMVLDFIYDNENLMLEINKVEKDSYVCKKYVLKNKDNITNIPFLLNVDQSRQGVFDYIKTFKNTITNIDILHEDVPLNERIDRKCYKKNIDKLVNFYFKKDIENLNEEELEIEIKQVLEIGESNDNK